MTDENRDPRDRYKPAAGDRDEERIDELLSALADSHRRYALSYLRDAERASLTETARQVAARKRGCAPPAVPDASLEAVEIRLIHVHLPILKETSLVEYDERSEQLVFRDPPALVERCLDHCFDRRSAG